MNLQGKGFFTWRLVVVEGGDPQAIVAQALAANLTHVLIKIANGILSYNIDPTTGLDRAQIVSRALRAQGVQVLGWHYVYGDNPIGEANIAIRRINEVGVDGYVIDAEQEYKRPGMRTSATRFMTHLRNALPTFPFALSTYRYPSYHPELPWREFLTYCDLSMPQVYWMQATNAGQQLIRCVNEYQAMTPYRPIVPTGAAFGEHGWKPTVSEVLEFLETAQSLNLPAVNFWEWSDARSRLLPIWDAIAAYPYGPKPQDISEQLIAALNSRDVSKIMQLYTPNAVHITSTRTIQGTNAISAWYNSLINQVLPNATFTLTGYTGSGNSRHFTWRAESTSGRVNNGNDTIGLAGDRIVYHYTFFTTTPS
jgi:hypothetical protein